MSNFDDFKKVAKETMETIADRSVELYKVAEEKTKIVAKRTKLSAEIAVEKGGIRNLYKEIGKVYYELHKDTPEMALKPLCAEIDEAMNRIDEKQKELDELKNSAAYADYTVVDEDEPEDDSAEEEEPPVEQAAEAPYTAPTTSAAEEAPASGTYDAAPQSESNIPPQSEPETPVENDWQKNYPPEFRL